MEDFEIQISENAIDWTTIKSITGNSIYENHISLKGTGRYVRMWGALRGISPGYSLWEFEVFGKLNNNEINSSGELCPGGNKALSVNLSGTNFQWQLNTGNGFVNIFNNGNYSGTNTATLPLNNIPSSWYGYQYRCIVDGVASSSISLKFVSRWTGASDTLWENASNWSCGAVPDANTDVIIGNGTVLVNSNAAIRSISLSPGVMFTVNLNYKFSVLH